MKFKKSIIGLMFSIIVFCFGIAVTDNQVISVNAVEKMVDGDIAYGYLQKIDSQFSKRTPGSQKELDMSQYIKSELDSFGYNSKISPFTYTRSGSSINSQNVIAIKKGKSEKQIIVGAHYDSAATNGVDDNGSGVSVTLETAKKMINKETPYTIVFVFFGAEEAGLQGSKAYVAAMEATELANTILMVNLDSVLAGTYPYIYGGVAQADGSVKDTWGVDQGIQLSNKLNLGLHLNNTKLNIDYPSPSTGNWSDHASFHKVGIPYVYLEASNWEVLDNPNKPELGSSGAAETTTGAVMHKVDRDNLSFIEQEWPNHGKNIMKTYSTFLYTFLQKTSPSGLIEDVKPPIYKKEIKENKTIYYKLIDNKYYYYKIVVKSKNESTTFNYIGGKKQTLDSAYKIILKNNKTIKKQYYKYNVSKKITSKTVYTLNNKNKFINTYNEKKIYYKNGKLYLVDKTRKSLTTNKYISKEKMTYTSLSIRKSYKKLTYKKGIKLVKVEYYYNKKGQLKSSAFSYKTKYNKKGKALQSLKYKYNNKGIKSKGNIVVTRPSY